MKGAVKIILALLSAFLILIAAAVGILWWILAPRLSGEVSKTHVSVSEGFVDVYKLASGGQRHFVKNLRQGDSADIEGRVENLSPVFEMIKPLFPAALQGLTEDIRIRAARVSRSKMLTHLYTQAEFDDLLFRRLRHLNSVSELRATINGSGLEGSARFKKIGFSVKVSGQGLILPDESSPGRLHLVIHRAKMGIFPMPAFLLRELEGAFSESQDEIVLPVKIMKMEYRPGAVLVSCQGLREDAVIKKLT